ncbi:MAG: TolC family outer membrane protein [Pseudomonadota bacterium]
MQTRKHGFRLRLRMGRSAAMGALLTGLAVSIPFAGAAAAETLAEALRLAFETNPTIQAARAEQRATGELKSQAWADILPEITAGGSYQEIDNDQTIDASVFDPTDPGPTPVPNSVKLSTLTAQVQGELTVFDGFRNVNALRQAAARVKAGGAQLASVEQDVLLRTATAYFDVLRDTAVYEANLNNVEVLVRQLQEAQLRFEVGEVTRTDVAQAEARLAGARAQLTSSQAQLAVSRALLSELTGQAPGTLAGDPALPTAPETLEQARSLGRGYAPQILAAKANEKASRKGIAIAKSAFAPNVALTSSYQYAEEPSNFVLDDEQFAYGVRASIPIFQGGRNLSRVREARALNDADRRRIEEAERRVDAAIASAWEQLQAANANIASAEAQLAANDLALRGVRREAQLGARTTLDVLNAEQEFLNAEVALAGARRDARVALFQLLTSAGILTLDAASGGTDPVDEG